MSTNIQFEDNSEIENSTGIYVDEDGDRCVGIKEFDLNTMHPLNTDDVERGTRIIIIGRPGRGKTSLIEQIMLFKGHICPVIQVASATERMNHFYKERVPDILVHDSLSMDTLIKDFTKRQEIAAKYIRNPWAMHILDDVVDDSTILRKPLINGFYRYGRHYRMLHILASQYPMDITPGLRTCVDYIFLFAESVLNNRRKIYENFASSCIPSFQDFCDLMDQLTENYTALVIDNTSESNNISDRIFYFRADKSRVPPNFRIGCDEAYAFQKQRMDPNYSPTML